MRFVFFGTPPFAARTLEALIKEGCIPALVVTQPDKPKGRSGAAVACPTKETALRHQIPVLQPIKASDPAFIQAVADCKPQLMVVVAYGQILRQSLLDVAPAINVHASLLPHLRGAAPIQWALIHGETTTGITIQRMSLAMDEGDILKQVSCPIDPEMNAEELSERLLELSTPALLDVLRVMPPAVPQDHTKATYAPKIESEQAFLDFRLTAPALHNLVRGCTPAPGAWTWIEIHGKKLRLKVLKTALRSAVGTPGQILAWNKEGITVACAEGGLDLQVVQLEGKTATHASSFVLGYPLSAALFSLSKP
jgi:methionyl-tRNA formyltransferase